MMDNHATPKLAERPIMNVRKLIWKLGEKCSVGGNGSYVVDISLVTMRAAAVMGNE